jgi:hypothetical protein
MIVKMCEQMRNAAFDDQKANEERRPGKAKYVSFTLILFALVASNIPI